MSELCWRRGYYYYSTSILWGPAEHDYMIKNFNLPEEHQSSAFVWPLTMNYCHNNSKTQRMGTKRKEKIQKLCAEYQHVNQDRSFLPQKELYCSTKCNFGPTVLFLEDEVQYQFLSGSVRNKNVPPWVNKKHKHIHSITISLNQEGTDESTVICSLFPKLLH